MSSWNKIETKESFKELPFYNVFYGKTKNKAFIKHRITT